MTADMIMEAIVAGGDKLPIALTLDDLAALGEREQLQLSAALKKHRRHASVDMAAKVMRIRE